MKTPELSIIMPLYNNENYVGKAIQSLIAQTYTDFELIIINDASTDNSHGIVKSFQDPRIKILENDKNEGIVYSRNRGLQIARGKFIAPFDSDDIALADKFEKQIAFLSKNPEFGMIGSRARMIDEEGRLLRKKWKLTASYKRIPAILLFRNYFVQSAMVIRREALPAEGYRNSYDVVEDYIMWFDIAKKYKVWNYPEYLVQYRIHPESATNSNAERLQKSDIKVFEYIYKPLGIVIDNKTAGLLLKIKGDEIMINAEELDNIEELLLLILQKNIKYHIYDQKQLTKVVFNRWLKSCYKARKQFWHTIYKFITSKILIQLIKSI